MRTITAQTNGGQLEVHLHANGQERELITWHDLTDSERENFDYIEGDERDSTRLFRYLGAVYDENEFEVAPAWVKRLGYDGWQTDSAFSAVIVRYFDEFGYERDGVVVARIHW